MRFRCGLVMRIWFGTKLYCPDRNFIGASGYVEYLWFLCSESQYKRRVSTPCWALAPFACSSFKAELAFLRLFENE